MKIRVKILIAIISTLSLILLIATDYSRRMVEKNHEAVLRDETSKIARQIESNIATRGAIADIEYLNEHLEEVMFLNSHISRIDILAYNKDGSLSPYFTKSKEGVGRTPLGPEETGTADHGLILINSPEGGSDFVNALAPIHLDGAVFGLAQVKISLEEFDNLVANKRKITLVTAAIAIGSIAAVLIISINQMVNKPIQNLLSAISRIKEGDLTVSVAPSASDEIGKLTGHFNGMVTALRENNAEREDLLARINRQKDELHTRVLEATDELRKRNEELQLAGQSIYEIQKKLGAARRLAAVGQLAATVAHEIGTPLHSVSGHLQILMEEPHIKSEDRRRLSIMQSQLERITNSIQDILNTTRRPEAGMGAVDVNGILEDIVILVMPETSSRGISLRTELAQELPMVWGSRERCEEVFLNLVDNAIDSMHLNGGEICITTAPAGRPAELLPQGASGNGHWVRIEVKDRGCGIDPALIPHIFEPFYTTKAHGHGTGLGLAISNEIVQDHHGAIKVQSRLNEGSVFTVYLPALEERTS